MSEHPPDPAIPTHKEGCAVFDFEGCTSPGVDSDPARCRCNQPSSLVSQRIREIKTPQQQWALACKMSVEIAGLVSQGADLSIEMAEAFKGLLQRSEEAEEMIAAQAMEIALLRIEQEKCDKCGTFVPRKFIAIEVKDGAPIDDPTGFQWCIVCHAQRVMAERDQALAAARQELATVREDRGTFEASYDQAVVELAAARQEVEYLREALLDVREVVTEKSVAWRLAHDAITKHNDDSDLAAARLRATRKED